MTRRVYPISLPPFFPPPVFSTLPRRFTHKHIVEPGEDQAGNGAVEERVQGADDDRAQQ